MTGKGRTSAGSAFRMTRLWAGLLFPEGAVHPRHRTGIPLLLPGRAHAGKGCLDINLRPDGDPLRLRPCPALPGGVVGMCAGMGIADDFLGKHGTHFVPNTMCTFHRLALDLGQVGPLAQAPLDSGLVGPL